MSKRNKHHWFSTIVMMILLIIGIIFIFNEPIKNALVRQMSLHYTANQLTAEQVKKNESKKASFDFDPVQSLDLKTVASAQLKQKNLIPLGGIAIPSIDLNLPIVKGTSNDSLSVGAGTMKPNEVMGKGNYALASHNMLKKGVLFSSLPDTKKGDLIYITNLDKIYTYKINRKFDVKPTQVDVINDHPGKKEITLVTCNTSGDQRFIVTGDYIGQRPFKHASPEMIKAFHLSVKNAK